MGSEADSKIAAGSVEVAVGEGSTGAVTGEVEAASATNRTECHRMAHLLDREEGMAIEAEVEVVMVAGMTIIAAQETLTSSQCNHGIVIATIEAAEEGISGHMKVGMMTLGRDGAISNGKASLELI